MKLFSLSSTYIMDSRTSLILSSYRMLYRVSTSTRRKEPKESTSLIRFVHVCVDVVESRVGTVEILKVYGSFLES